MVDSNAIISAYLRASGSSLYALCGARVYVPALPPKWENTAASLEVFRRGGSSQREHELHENSYQIKCYGGTNSMADAETVYRALYDRLHNINSISTAHGAILWAHEEVIGQNVFDPATGIPYVLTFWNVTTKPTT
jgi:hypothetical protein